GRPVIATWTDFHVSVPGPGCVHVAVLSVIGWLLASSAPTVPSCMDCAGVPTKVNGPPLIMSGNAFEFANERMSCETEPTSIVWPSAAPFRNSTVYGYWFMRGSKPGR